MTSSIQLEERLKEVAELPIGIFDSGIGGLTVLKEILKQVPYENTIYLGDTARVPYGIRSPETVTRYSFENTRFLISQGIKFLVVACNTSSSISLADLKKKFSLPITGVIEPGARAAVSQTRTGKIAVIGTEAAIKSRAYAKTIKAFDDSIEVTEIACPLFVPLVEEGWTEGDIAGLVAEKYLSTIKGTDIDTLVLGCTHYPMLKNVIGQVLGQGVTLIDSGVETAREVRQILVANAIMRRNSKDSQRKFFVTDSPEKFISTGEKFLRHKITHISKIELGG